MPLTMITTVALKA